MKTSIGKNTLGQGSKMTLHMRNYERSSHNLSYAWRSSMGVGTLVPCMKILSTPGGTFDIEIDEKVFTHPTVGPLFGSYKMQVDIFTCPMRLYMAPLHNNALNVGLDMAKVKIPQLNKTITTDMMLTGTDSKEELKQISSSSVLAYLGIRGWKNNMTVPDGKVCHKNAIPLLAYLDIFKNYYANKQEEKFYSIYGFDQKLNYIQTKWNASKSGTQFKMEINIEVTGYDSTIQESTALNNTIFDCDVSTYKVGEGTAAEGWVVEATYQYTAQGFKNMGLTVEFTSGILSIQGTLYSDSFAVLAPSKVYYNENGLNTLKEYDLTSLDKLREDILAKGYQQVLLGDSPTVGCNYIEDLLMSVTETSAGEKNSTLACAYPQSGLILKTHQSDIFNNWINSEWIDGDNGISAITAIDTSSGEFTIDTLNMAKKVYDMLNRIAVSGGSYRDWIETVYTNNYALHAETPIYEGGMSCEIEFEEVVSNSASIDQPLGTLAGRGRNTSKKGGKLHINIAEPSYIIGIVSITPRVDYCQGNDWDTVLETMNDLHKPALDGIGFQDLMAWKLAWWADEADAIGKQPAWLDYMTNFNKTYGTFAEEGNESFMVLNRYYDPIDNYTTHKIDATTYINPAKYNYIFAQTGVESQNFWVQLGFKITARRKMSAKQIPNL